MPLFKKWWGPFIAYIIAGIFEQFEIFSRVFFGVFITFFTKDGLSAEPETFVGSYLEDWAIQGGLGAFLLGGLFIHAIDFPPFIWGTREKSRKHTWYYLGVLIFYVLPFVVFSIDLDNGFPLGPLIVVLWQPVWVGLVVLTEGHYMGTYSEKRGIWISGRWKGYTRGQRLLFWWGIAAIITPFMAQNLFDWLYSNAIQSYLMVVVYIYILLLMWKLK
jgi:hypothetical protein